MKFDEFFELVEPLLKEYNCEFGYQRKGCKKHGHYKKTIIRKTKEVKYEIKIEKNDTDAGKIYTLIHEMTHMINQHLDSKEITYSQQEWVADKVAKEMINFLSLENEIKESLLFKEKNLDDYADRWMYKKQISERRYLLMRDQYRYTTKIIKKTLFQ